MEKFENYEINGKALADAEKYVLRKVKAGEPADLKKYANNPDHRNLRGKFLENLICNKFGDKIPRSGIQISNAIIISEFEIAYAEIEHVVKFLSCTFKKAVNMQDCIFKKHFYIDESIFEGPFDINGSEIGKQFSADKAQFLDEKTLLYGLKVMHDAAFFGDVKFKGKISLSDGNFFSLLIGSEKQYVNLPNITLRRAVVDNLRIQNIEIDELDIRYTTIKKSAIFEKVSIKNKVDLRDSVINGWQLIDVKLPYEFIKLETKQKGKKESILLDGLTYNEISAKKEGKQDWEKLIDLVDNSRFNTQNYNQLDAYFQRCGLGKWAYKVYKSGKLRAVNLLPCWKKWPTRILWGVLAGYGRKPYLSLPWIVLFVALGALFFSLSFDSKTLESHAYLKQMAENYPWPTKIILSLDRFLPGVDLGVAKHWAPPENFCFWGWIYWHVQKLLGWILIPIALAAIYTRLK
jgi:hypothetical protein